MIWLERWRLRRAARNVPAEGLTILFADDGEVQDVRPVRLWQRGWVLHSEPVPLFATMECHAATAALYDGGGRELGRQPVSAVLTRWDRVTTRWTVNVEPSR